MPGRASRPFGIAAWLAVPLGLSACTGGGRPAPGAHVAKPGYVCNIGVPLENGASAQATLDAAGRQVSARWEWKAADPETFLQIEGVLMVDGPRPLRVQDGYASVQWYVPLPPAEQRALLRLELRADPDSRAWTASGFVGDPRQGGKYLVMASWPDMAAFARGAPRLYAVLRDRQAAIMKRTSVDSALFARGEAQIAATLDGLARKVADFRASCEAIDDIDPVIVL
jgi:hypothetical protein